MKETYIYLRYGAEWGWEVKNLLGTMNFHYNKGEWNGRGGQEKKWNIQLRLHYTCPLHDYSTFDDNGVVYGVGFTNNVIYTIQKY